jgi:hypothetical protein
MAIAPSDHSHQQLSPGHLCQESALVFAKWRVCLQSQDFIALVVGYLNRKMNGMMARYTGAALRTMAAIAGMDFRTARGAAAVAQFWIDNRSTNSEWPLGAAESS